jgi:glycerophosphoryl diester phosphodiesterase
MTADARSLPAFMKIGHRGARGLMPENTIPSMEKAIKVGANMLEMDVHITRDGQVIVYHDESFDPGYTSMPDGSDIPGEERKRYTFYQMNYKEIKPFIIGRKAYPVFPKQQKLATYAPLLSELIDSVEAFTKSRKSPPVYYLVEVKSKEESDGVEQPPPEEFVKLLMAVLTPKTLGKRLILQSFDRRPLQVLRRHYPDIALGFLTDDTTAAIDDNLGKLGFTPAFYNPHFSLVNDEMVGKCHEKNILVAPWTVNDPQQMKKLKDLKVDGIITDYPDLLNDL